MKKVMTIKKTSIIAAAGLVFVLALSLILFFVQSYPRVGRVFFFPRVGSGAPMVGERHLVPRHRAGEKNVEEYVGEWLLGPLDLDNSRLFPQGTRLRSVLLRGETLYLDFSLELLLKQETVSLPFREILAETAGGIGFNFPWVKNFVFFIEGEPVEMEESLRAQEA